MERILGIMKSRFPILRVPQSYPVQRQVSLVYALCTVHNLINVFQKEPDAIQCHAEQVFNEQAGYNLTQDDNVMEDYMLNMRRQIAEDMWNDYQTALARRQVV